MEQIPNPKCNRCHCYWKPDETDVKSSGLVFNTCKRCRDNQKEHNKKYREQNADKLKEYKKEWYENNADKVKEHNKKYRENNPDKRKESNKKWREQNADKIKENNKKYREQNADKLKEYLKEWREQNADNQKEYNKNYREQNADKIKETQKKYNEKNKCEHNKRYRECKICNLPLYLINIQRGQIKRCFKLSSENKTKSSIEYLGCDAEYFIEYFEKKMDLWNYNNDIKMEWDNIHIDHIKPVSSFDLDDEDDFLDCCHYSNLQPLLATDNLSKHNKWSDEYDVYWSDNIKGKEHLQIYIPMV